MRRTLVSAIALALAGVSMAASAQTSTAAPEVRATTQLPRDVRPTHYDVAVVPHAESLSFDGKVAITLDVLQPTASIVLQALDMTFSSVRLTPVAGHADYAAPQVKVDAEAQTATFVFPQPLPVGQYRLAMDYTGKIGTQANGLFAIDYDTKAGKKRALFTQFENSDARRFIPSWDEPDYKATFDLTATVPSSQMAVSNMPAAENDRPRQRHHAGAFRADAEDVDLPAVPRRSATSSARPRPSDGTEVGVVTQKGLASQAGFALRVVEGRAARVQRLFRRALSAAQARQHRLARSQPVLRRDGELGRDLYLRVRAAARSDDLDADRTSSRCSRSPRTRSRTSGSATS